MCKSSQFISSMAWPSKAIRRELSDELLTKKDISLSSDMVAVMRLSGIDQTSALRPATMSSLSEFLLNRNCLAFCSTFGFASRIARNRIAEPESSVLEAVILP